VKPVKGYGVLCGSFGIVSAFSCQKGAEEDIASYKICTCEHKIIPVLISPLPTKASKCLLSKKK
jgi:hypothetical protein